jgi:rhodanese-related sulfurtransferase/DNA-binding transcriptional ArsR family regulator
MEKREFKDKVFGELSRISSAMANPKRLEIIDLLAQGERTVEKIALETSMSTANASQHLQVLKNANLVEIKRNGNFIIYKISDEKVVMIWQLLREFGTARIAEVEKVVKDFRAQKKVFDSVSIDELLQKIEHENVVLLDVRPEEEYEAGHIANAVSIPFDKLSKRLKELPKNKEIIAYCRGPFCVFADEAIQLLLKNKFKAKRLEEGFPDWKLKGLPIEVNSSL